MNKEELDSMLSQLKSQRPGRRNNFFTAKWTIKLKLILNNWSYKIMIQQKHLCTVELKGYNWNNEFIVSGKGSKRKRK